MQDERDEPLKRLKQQERVRWVACTHTHYCLVTVPAIEPELDILFFWKSDLCHINPSNQSVSHLGQEPGVVHKHTVHTLAHGMEEADLLTIHIHHHRGIPGISILIIPVWGGIPQHAAEGQTGNGYMHTLTCACVCSGCSQW
jgi:hypothetical protein